MTDQNEIHAANKLFEGFVEEVRKSGYPAIENIRPSLEITPAAKFGVWLVSETPGSFAIRLNLGTLRSLRSFIDLFVRKCGKDFITGLFDTGATVKPRRLRTETSKLLYEIAFQWLMAHEVSHWLLGHPAFLYRNENLADKSVFSETAHDVSGFPLHKLNPMESLAAEMQADSHAFELLEHVYQSGLPGQRSILHRAKVPIKGPEDRYLYLRLLMVACGMVMLQFEFLHAPKYPKPATRIFNLLKMGFALGNLDAFSIVLPGHSSQAATPILSSAWKDPSVKPSSLPAPLCPLPLN